jgi:hypothetical protein
MASSNVKSFRGRLADETSSRDRDRNPECCPAALILGNSCHPKGLIFWDQRTVRVCWLIGDSKPDPRLTASAPTYQNSPTETGGIGGYPETATIAYDTFGQVAELTMSALGGKADLTVTRADFRN